MDIKEAIALKADAVKAGLALRKKIDKLRDTDERLPQYVRGVYANPEGHNLWEVLAVTRFLRLLGDYTWRADKVRHFITYYEGVKFSGVKGRRRYKLTPVQVFQFASILGFERDDGRRLTREVILFVPRKFSKTTSVASLAAYELLFGDANAQAYTGANSYTQAQICFKEISAIVRQFDEGQTGLFRINREHLEWEQPNKFGKESFVECLTGNSSTKDGLNASLVIMDEYAAASYVKDRSEGAELLNVLRSSMGVRENPLVVIITTASRVPDGPFSIELDGAKRVLLGEEEDDTLFAHIFEPDLWDYEDLGREEVWRKCNPHIGVTVKEDYYALQWQAALRDAEKMAEFKTKLLNVFINGSAKAWFERRQLDALRGKFDIEKVTGRPPTMVAIDLSVSDDFSVVTYSIYSRTNRCFYIYSDYYIPEVTLAEHPNRTLYRTWVDAGWMKVCPGAVIDYGMIRDDIIHRNARLKILQIGYDSYKSLELINSLRATMGKKQADRTLVPVSQTYGSFTSGVETFEMAAKRDPPSVVLHENPIQIYCLANAAIDEDKMRNKKPIKRKANLKIDSAVTTCMTFIMWNTCTT